MSFKSGLFLRIWKSYQARVVVIRRFFLGLLVGHLGDDVNPYGWPKLYAPEKLDIGSHVTINYGVFIDARGGVRIGNNVRLSPYSVIETGYLEKTGSPRKHGAKPIVIGDNVWVASGAKVLAGVTIGENSIIAAGAVVTKSVPPNSLAKGIPAQIFPLE